MPSFRLSAHHVTSPDTSRGATQHARLKSVQSQNAPSLFPCAKSLRRRISSQIGWLTQNPEPSSQPADPRDGARDGLDAPAHRSAPGLTSRTRSTQRQVDISRQLSRRHRLLAANYKDRGTRLHRPVVVASPAGRTGLREARAAPDRAPAVLLNSMRASSCALFMSRTKRSPKLAGCLAAQLERNQVQPEPHEARSGRPDRPRRLAGASECRGPCSCLPASCGGFKVA